jgi:hypothetical protein
MLNNHSRAKARQGLRSLARLSEEVEELRRQVLIAERAQLRRQTGKSRPRTSARLLSIASYLENSDPRMP